MEGFEIDACLDSFCIKIDSREQPSERARKRYAAFGVPYSVQTLNYGDYTYNFKLPSGEWLFNDTDTISGHCVIERKMSLTELSGNLCQNRKRFKEEFRRAKENNASVYLLVEDASWEALLNGRYNTKFNPNAYFGSICSFMARYNIQLIFCKKELSGKLIKEILYRELKTRLETGFYG